jgi:beta-phosphoglucomutase-like phosphatase (HAD superfamily)
MGLLNPGSGTGGPRARAQRLDTALGILGFFAVMATIQTVVLEVRGKPAGFAAATLTILLVLLWLVWRARSKTGV